MGDQTKLNIQYPILNIQKMIVETGGETPDSILNVQSWISDIGYSIFSTPKQFETRRHEVLIERERATDPLAPHNFKTHRVRE